MTKYGGRRVAAEIDGKRIICTTIGGLATAVGRTSRTIRFWEQIGLLPPAPFRVANDNPDLRRRLYPVALVEQIQRVCEQEEFADRRPSMFSRQQELLWATSKSVMESLISNRAAGVAEDADR